MSTPSPRTVTPEWRMVFPPGWVSISTDPAHAPAAIKRVLDRTMEGRSRDELVSVRIELDQKLRELAATAHEKGASHLHFLAEPIRGVPVSASLTVSTVAGSSDGELPAALLSAFGEANGILDLGREVVGTRPALRRLRRFEEPPTNGEGTATVHHCLDYVIDSGDGTLVLLAFVTDTEPVAEQLVAVFDFMAATLERHEA